MVSSILIYSIVFFTSCFAAWRYERIDKNRAEKPKSAFLKIYISNLCFRKAFWAFFVVFPPVFIAAFRSLEVGTDTANYLSIYNINKYYNIIDYIKIYGTSKHDYEPGYQQILYISYIFGGGYNLAKAICEFLIVGFAWRGAIYYSRKFQVSTAMCMFFFYMLEFSYGFNGVRYAIGLSLFYYGFQFVIERKPVKYLICCFFMATFHSAFVLSILYYAINYTTNKTFRKYIKYISIGLIVVIVLSLRQLIAFAIPIISAFTPRFKYEIDISKQFGVGIYLIFLLFLFPVIKWDSYISDNKDWCYILVSVLTFIPLRFIGYFNSWLIRLSRMPEIIFSVLYSGVYKISRNKSSRVIWLFYVVILVIIFYILDIIVGLSGEVYPYIFDFTNYI